MKARFLTVILVYVTVVAVSVSAQNRDFNGYRFFINPGHGGFDSDDRHMSATGFWESEGNLKKALFLRSLLENEKSKVFLSRTTNNTEDDLDFAVIDEMANAANVDFFISIHSNGGSGKINRPLMLFRGYDNKPVFNIAGEMAEIMWYKVFENGKNWTNNEPYIKGDWSFYPNWGKQGLGVLRALAVPGVLTEGSFHDYLPESWRLRNDDFLKHESWALFRSLKSFYGISKQSPGVVCGVVSQKSKPVNNVKVGLSPGDRYYVTDSLNNGFYYFEDLEPGNYRLTVYKDAMSVRDTASIVVKPDSSTIRNFKF